jgi:dihydropteroate synthase
MRPEDFSSWLTSSLQMPMRRRPLVMGILNVTPDSFSDGGRHADPDDAIAAAVRMADEGADLLDIGGESTRPGSQPVSADEQIRRVLPVIDGIVSRKLPVTLSIDTTSARVGQVALDAGANFLNDISGGRDDTGMLPLAGSRGVPIVLMHMQGTPATMQDNPSYADVTADIAAFLSDRLAAARAADVKEEQIILDPGIGFGKTLHHDLSILHDLSRVGMLGRPILVGVSRKKFIGFLNRQPAANQRVMGTAGAVAWCVTQGVSIVRVHDVKEIAQTVRVVDAIMRPDSVAP